MFTFLVFCYFMKICKLFISRPLLIFLIEVVVRQMKVLIYLSLGVVRSSNYSGMLELLPITTNNQGSV